MATCRKIDRPSRICDNLRLALIHTTSGPGAILTGLDSHYETYLPTLEDSPRPHARFFGAHEDPWWPCRDQRAPRQRPQAPGCLKSAVPAGCCPCSRLDASREAASNPASVPNCSCRAGASQIPPLRLALPGLEWECFRRPVSYASAPGARDGRTVAQAMGQTGGDPQHH